MLIDTERMKLNDYFKPQNDFNMCDHCKYRVDRRDIDYPCCHCKHNVIATPEAQPQADGKPKRMICYAKQAGKCSVGPCGRSEEHDENEDCGILCEGIKGYHCVPMEAPPQPPDAETYTCGYCGEVMIDGVTMFPVDAKKLDKGREK